MIISTYAKLGTLKFIEETNKTVKHYRKHFAYSLVKSKKHNNYFLWRTRLNGVLQANQTRAAERG
jgi:hypothetical protein